MKSLNSLETSMVCGGDGDVDASLGSMIGHALHGLTSDEAVACGMLSPAGVFVGAVLHFVNKH
ncbi:hypothetical protein [Arenimonas sp. MALMAid1274]|uniref:hypothetical protein n=1 Tax=Arenimonas sp. MALMAid1274 TaxID=3411630 RepID=UPI003BA276B8